MHTDLYVYIHTNSSDSHLCSWVSCSWKLGYWNPAGKLNRNIKLLNWYQLFCLFGAFNIALTMHSPLGGMSHSVCVRKQCDARGAYSALTFTACVLCEVSPGWELQMDRSRRKSNEYIKLLINILSEGVFLMPLLSVNQLRWSIWSGRTCFNSVLLLETPGESFHWIPTRNWEVTICARRSSVHSRTGISYFGCGIPVLFSWMRRPSRGLISEQAELKNSAACPGSGTAFTYVPCYWSVCIYAHLCCLSLLCWQLLNVGFYV